jgi:hypothetical protein
VIVSSQTGPKSITVPEIRDDFQLTLLTAIAASGDSTPPFFVSKTEAFRKGLLAELEICEGHDQTIKTAPKTFMTEVLFIEWLQTLFLPWVETRRQNMHSDSPLGLFLDGHATVSLPD